MTRRRVGDVIRGKEGDKGITAISEKLGKRPGGRGTELGLYEVREEKDDMLYDKKTCKVFSHVHL